MKWKKLGKIFDPTEYRLPNKCLQFAQSPQALVFDDFVRIYFSTREMDATNKPLSHIAYADFEKNFRKAIGISQHTVIPLGNLGSFDEHGIFPMNVVRYKDKIYGYTCGWSRRVSVSIETSIGVAISNDNGQTFQKNGDGPVLTSSLREPFLVGDPFVTIHNGLFHMWYIFGVKWKRFSADQPPDRIYKIGHAVSQDGFLWSKEDGRQIIGDRINTECQALPTVINISGRWHMFFCYRHAFDFRHNRERSYRIGYAYSDNGHDWVRDDSSVGIDVSAGEWDSDMMCYPNVFACNNKIYLLYNGNDFGRYGFGIAVLDGC